MPLPHEPDFDAEIPAPVGNGAHDALGHYAQERLRRLIAMQAQRQSEGLRLYEPLPAQNVFHSSTAPERIVRGSNRGGKTLPAAVEFARAVTAQDPFGKYPREDGRAFAVAMKGKLVAEVLWHKLSRAQAFKMIRDERTKLWRAFRPWQEFDYAYREKAKWAPPLIPRRLIVDIGWENKKEDQPNKVKIKTGWEINFFSSEGKPPNGVDVDLAWFDEEIVDPQWYYEMSARLLDRGGKFFWSATPQNATQQLFDLHCRAEDGDPNVHEVVVLLDDNPHITRHDKDLFAAKMSDDERRVRVEGEFALSGYKVYPEFAKRIHVVPYFEIPEHWMRLVATDPGRQVCAALFAAVPPEDDAVYFYDEIYLKQADAERYGQAMRAKCGVHSHHKFLIDGRAARQGEIGSGKTVQRQYAEALARHGVRSETTGANFQWGCDDLDAGIAAFRAWLRIGPKGKPKLRVLEGTCPNLVEFEVGRYHYRRVRGLVTDQPEKKNDHLMDCCRYLAMEDPRYVKPQPPRKRKSPALAALEAKRKRAAEKDGGRRGIYLGPGGGMYGTGRR